METTYLLQKQILNVINFMCPEIQPKNSLSVIKIQLSTKFESTNSSKSVLR